MNYQDFLAWLQLRETLADSTQPYLEECYNYAYNQSMVISQYLAPFQLKAYVYCLATHLIILTPNTENLALHLKYFPDDTSGANGAIGAIPSSVSNATSSVGIVSYAGLQNLDLKDAMLTSTPYGMEVASMSEGLSVGVVVV